MGRDDRRELRPPPLRIPPRLPVGDTWSSRYTAGTLPVTVRASVLRRDAVEIDGRRLPAVVVSARSPTPAAHTPGGGRT